MTKKILVIDDNPEDRLLVQAALEGHDFELLEAENGKAGLERLKQDTVDLVLLDFHMPEMDGPGVLQALRAQGSKIPIVFLTSETQRSAIAPLLALEVEGYLVKPCKADQLIDKVERIVYRDKTGPPTDLLAIGKNERVTDQLKSVLPNGKTIETCSDTKLALSLCRRLAFNLVIIDLDLADADSFLAVAKKLQPEETPFVALALRTQVMADVMKRGYANLIYKPFDTATVGGLLTKYLERDRPLLAREENLIRIASYTGAPGDQTQLGKFFWKTKAAAVVVIEEIAGDCFKEVIIDLSALPVVGHRLSDFVAGIAQLCAKLAIRAKFVGPAEVGQVLHGTAETQVALFASVAEAKSQSTPTSAAAPADKKARP
jgi:CheY-like chemotaxis protein